MDPGPPPTPLDSPAATPDVQSPDEGRLRRLLSVIGPGFITGASDDDPSGIGTYASIGAAQGFSVLWLAPLTFPLMAAVQLICARIGLVTGEGIAGVLRRNYPRWVRYPAIAMLVVANTINAGVDIGAIAAGVNLLVPIPTSALTLPIGLLILALQILGSYRLIARVFKWLTLALLTYVGAAFLARPDWGEVLRGTLLPSLHLDGDLLMALVAVLGTTISPYLFFWQASEEVEEEISAGRESVAQRAGATDRELRAARWDVGAGMAFSNVVMYFIILASAATLHTSGQRSITSAAEAAQALEPLAGRAAEALFAIGIIGAGMLAIPILTGSAAYAVAEGGGWRSGLSTRPRDAKVFYAVIITSTLIGMLIDFSDLDTITALYWTAVLNGLLAPPLLVLVLLIANNRSVMGERTNGRTLNLLGWGAVVAMSAAALALLWTWR